MNETVPSVTVVIAARPEQIEIKAVTASRLLDYPADKLEIIVARGKQPSVQRNAALKAARGELIYFLDDDSDPQSGNLSRAISHFTDPKVKMVGGPNLCPPDAPARERVFALVLASWLAVGPSRARYFPVGQVRETSEKELILCNLVARREAMLELGGFNEALYPNEENALMDELQERGGKLIYDPEFIVHRRPRPTLKAFAKMLLTYGRGRTEQVRLHPTFRSALNFIPLSFCVYLAFLLPLWMVLGKVAFLPLIAYALVLTLQACDLFRTAFRTERILHIICAVLLIVPTHVLYGFGTLRGLFTKLRSPQERPPTQVVLEVVASGSPAAAANGTREQARDSKIPTPPTR